MRPPAACLARSPGPARRESGVRGRAKYRVLKFIFFVVDGAKQTHKDIVNFPTLKSRQNKLRSVRSKMFRLHALICIALFIHLDGICGFAYERLAISALRKHPASNCRATSQKKLWSMVQTPPRPAASQPSVAKRVSIQDMSRQMADARQQVALPSAPAIDRLLIFFLRINY